MSISRTGHAKEDIGNGCCDPQIDVHFTLSHPRETSSNASALARVTMVRVRSDEWLAKWAPRLGQTRRIRLKGGVLTETLTGHTTYCDEKAGGAGRCGA